MLYEFVAANRDEIISRCRAKVATRSVPPPTEAEIQHGVPVFLAQLVDSLRFGLSSNPEITDSALLHGHDLLHQGFSISQVVHDYGDVCQSITEMAMEANTPISNDDFRVLNKSLDDAIAGAVSQYGREGNRSAVDGEAVRGNERHGFFIHELRNLINTAILAFEVVKSGNVGVAGSTGTVLHRTLVRVRDLVSRSLAEVRLAQGAQTPTRFLASTLIDELAPAARLTTDASGLTLVVGPVEAGAAIEGDREVLEAVLMNLLQNAFKFTRPRTTVTLRVGASAERVLFEVQDHCGGLPDGDVNGLFRPFEQRGASRTGLGLGLPFSRWGAEANRGRVYARNIPSVGCVFTLDLPRFAGSAPDLGRLAGDSP